MPEAIEKLQKEFGKDRIWIRKVNNNSFIKYTVYFDSYIIGCSDSSYDVLKKAINYYI